MQCKVWGDWTNMCQTKTLEMEMVNAFEYLHKVVPRWTEQQHPQLKSATALICYYSSSANPRFMILSSAVSPNIAHASIFIICGSCSLHSKGRQELPHPGCKRETTANCVHKIKPLEESNPMESIPVLWCFWRPWVVVICFKTYILVTSILTNLPFLPPFIKIWVTWAWRSKKLVQPWWFCLP